MRSRTTSRAGRASSRAVVAALGLALVLGGCGGAAGDDEAGEEYVPSPLDEYFERAYAGTEDVDWEAQQREVEELTAACMQEQGFDYVPMDVSGSYTEVVVPDGEEEIDWDSEEYAATEGYGISTWDDEESSPEVEEGQEWEDPNQAYLDSMSESEQEAFYEALHGPAVEYDEEDPDAEMDWDWTTAGCSGEAQHEVDGGVGDPFSDPAFASLEEEMDALWESMTTNADVLALDAEWSECMADAGFPGYSSQTDPQEEIDEEMQALYETTSEETDWQVDPAALEELQEREIDTAVADFRCAEEVDYDTRYAEISRQVEQAFVDSHRAELEAWVEATGAGS
ncbi:hypothetical protein [Pseudokineococcus sp. 1T1Z-3]|uniref:hypothetical protein n=1 Tax=Pseudokineococcus sp. 1T1Z-3 TaxID=3132745 RepID=UPI0030A286A4